MPNRNITTSTTTTAINTVYSGAYTTTQYIYNVESGRTTTNIEPMYSAYTEPVYNINYSINLDMSMFFCKKKFSEKFIQEEMDI